MRRSALLGIAAIIATSVLPARAQEVTTVTGAGSTFAFPLLKAWSRAYLYARTGSGDYPTINSGLDDAPSGATLDYEPIGSLAGTMRVTSGAVDFGASDVPLKPDELSKLRLGQFPIVIGGVVAVVNVDGIGPGQLRLTGQVLADIYLGRIQTWSDPAIKALNPDLRLPDARIAVIHRADGSGTTYNFARYLAGASLPWREKLGVDTTLAWPLGTGVKGNDGMARAVRQTGNAIGYVDYAQAVQAKLSFALVQNKAGKFIRPEPRTFQAAAASAAWDPASDFHVLLTDALGDEAYPIVATVFVLMQKQPGWMRRPRETLGFFRWSLDDGARHAAALGYVPLPPALVGQIKDYWARHFKSAI